MQTGFYKHSNTWGAIYPGRVDTWRYIEFFGIRVGCKNRELFWLDRLSSYRLISRIRLKLLFKHYSKKDAERKRIEKERRAKYPVETPDMPQWEKDFRKELTVDQLIEYDKETNYGNHK